MKTLTLSTSLVKKTLPAPGFEPTTFRTKFLSAAAFPILAARGLVMLSSQSGPFQVASTLGRCLAVAGKLSRPKVGLTQVQPVKKIRPARLHLQR